MLHETNHSAGTANRTAFLMVPRRVSESAGLSVRAVRRTHAGDRFGPRPLAVAALVALMASATGSYRTSRSPSLASRASKSYGHRVERCRPAADERLMADGAREAYDCRAASDGRTLLVSVDVRGHVLTVLPIRP